MIEIQVNIGLNVSDRFPQLQKAYGPVLNPSVAVDALYDILEGYSCMSQLRGMSTRVAQSNTEQTVVARLRFAGSSGAALFLASMYRHGYKVINSLGQDCVAVYQPANGKGTLIGQHAIDWGEFNPEYFIKF